MTRRWPQGLIALATLLSTVATCADLERDRPVLDQCGNRVVEGIEDCDGNRREEASGVFDCGTIADGPAQACHWRCTNSTCPTGFVCDTRGEVCYAPSLTFTESEADLAQVGTGVPILDRVGGLSGADLDGEAPAELVVHGGAAVDLDADSLYVSFFDRGARSRGLRREKSSLKRAVPVAVSHRPGEPSVMFVAPHPRVPSVLPLRGQRDESVLPGLAALWGGLSERALLSPHSLPSEDLKRGLPTAVFDGGRTGGLAPGVSGGLPGWLIETPVLFRADYGVDDAVEVVSRMGHGRLVPGGPEARAVGLRRHLGIGGTADVSTIHVYTAEAHFLLPQFHSVELPRGMQLAIDGGVWIGLVDDDAFGDLMFAADDGNTYVAYGVGDESFEPVSPTPLILETHPLAVGLIDGDDRVDFVFPSHGVALSVTSSFFEPCPGIQSSAEYACGKHNGFPPGEPPAWSDAVVADVNADGRLDVVASGIEPFVQVFLSQYTSAQSPALLLDRTLTTVGTPRDLTVGDVDFDGVKDILFHTAGRTASSPASLYVAFSATSGELQPPTKLLEAQRFLSMEAAELDSFVYLLSQDGSEEARWSILTPSADRELSMPLAIPCVAQYSASVGDRLVEQQLAAGHFGGPGVDAALLYRDCFAPVNEPAQDRLVLVPSTPNGGLGAVLREPWDIFSCDSDVLSCQAARRAFRPTGIDLDVPAGWSSTALLSSVDLDRDGVDELVLLGPDGAGAGRVLVARSDGEPEPRFEILQDDPVGAALGGAYESSRGAALSADLDGDGFADLAVLTTPLDDQPRELILLMGDQLGGLRTAAPVRVSLASWCGNAEGCASAEVNAFALMDADLDGVEDEILLTGESGVFLTRLDLDLGQLVGATEVAQIQGKHLVAADFDGDNLTDFAVSYFKRSPPGSNLFQGDVVKIFRSVPKNP